MRAVFWTLAPLGLAVLTLALGQQTLGAAHFVAMSPPVRLLSGLLLAGALLTAFAGARSAPRLRLAIVLVTMTIVTSLLGLRALGPWPFVWDGFGSAAYAGFLAVVMLATTIGLARDALWARWVAITFALAAIGTGGLNAVWSFGRHDEWAWMPLVSMLCGVLLCLGLFHPTMAERYSRRRGEELWASPDAVVRLSRWAAIANMLAIPMLLVYGVVQPVVPSTVGSAFALIPLLAIGSALVLRQKVVGVLVLGGSGVLLAIQTLVTLRAAHATVVPTALYYTVFWTPAATLGIVAAIGVLRRAGALRRVTNRA